MNLNEILTGGTLSALALLTLIQIAPIKINPWSAIAKAIGRAINGEVKESVDGLRRDVTALQTQQAADREDRERDRADTRRIRILRFSDEMRQGTIRHSEESFNQTLSDIDEYERYCDTHPGYLNTKAETAIKRIKKQYAECVEKNSFL